MNKDRIAWIAGIILVPVIIYFYFLKWKTGTIYGDDLYMYIGFNSANGFNEKFHYLISSNKFRPVNEIVFTILINLFQKNLDAYYLFNIAIQAINTLILARLLNLFLKSPLLSLLFGLLLGLSRFSFYNISQLFNGGALEGLAITFYLLCVFYLVQASLYKEKSVEQKRKDIIKSILYANLCMYTHERYIVLFPFIILMVFLFPASKSLTLKQKGNLGILAVLSVAINIIIKKYILAMPFFVGTGGTNISFSFTDAMYYFADGVRSIFQINSHPDYLTGLPFAFLSNHYKIFALAIAAIISILFILFLIRGLSNKKYSDTNLFLFISLIILFIASMTPAIITIRLEQRWLQASFAIFLILIIIALSELKFKNKFVNLCCCLIFTSIFQWSDFHYMNKGASILYMNSAQKTASFFKYAIENNTIHPNTKNIYLYLNQRNHNGENEISWSIANGGICEFYQNNNKNIYYVDSVFERINTQSDTSLIHFNKNSDQIVYLKDSIIDITPQFLSDSLKNFKG